MRKALIAAATALVLAGAGLVAARAGYLPDVSDLDSGAPTTTKPAPAATSTPTPTPTPAGDVLAAAPPAAAPPDPAILAARLDPLLSTPALGADVTALVVDPTTGGLLYARRDSAPQTPASTAKLLTAAAALTTLSTVFGIETRVVNGPARGQIVLVGGGDPTLTAFAQSATAYPRWASLSMLANRTATALRRAGIAQVTLSVDDSLFTGPSAAPSWPSTYVTSGVVARVSALMIDEARVRRGSPARSPDPALAAGARFAAMLAAAGIKVAGPVRSGPAVGPGTQSLASVESPPIPVLVEHMLRTSDNDLAESLARLVAHASGRPASFAGYASVLPAILARLGIAGAGVRLVDGSGLSRTDLVTARALGSLLSRAATGGDQRLRPLLSGLPVAGYSGTLAGRFTRAPTAAAAGEVRAKTGTLTGVISLAGTVFDNSERLLVFAVIADRVPGGGALAARSALDSFAAALAACGCN